MDETAAIDRDLLALDNAGLAGSIALRYHHRRGGRAAAAAPDYDDLRQVALLALVKAARGHDGVRPFAAYAGQAIRRAVWEEIRLLCRGGGAKTEPLPPALADEAGALAAAEADEAAEMRRRVEAMLGGLPPKLAGPVRLCDLEGLTLKEAGARLGCSPKMVSQRRGLALRLLRRRAAAAGEEGRR